MVESQTRQKEDINFPIFYYLWIGGRVNEGYHLWTVRETSNYNYTTVPFRSQPHLENESRPRKRQTNAQHRQNPKSSNVEFSIQIPPVPTVEWSTQVNFHFLTFSFPYAQTSLMRNSESPPNAAWTDLTGTMWVAPIPSIILQCIAGEHINAEVVSVRNAMTWRKK